MNTARKHSPWEARSTRSRQKSRTKKGSSLVPSSRHHQAHTPKQIVNFFIGRCSNKIGVPHQATSTQRTHATSEIVIRLVHKVFRFSEHRKLKLSLSFVQKKIVHVNHTFLGVLEFCTENLCAFFRSIQAHWEYLGKTRNRQKRLSEFCPLMSPAVVVCRGNYGPVKGCSKISLLSNMHAGNALAVIRVGLQCGMCNRRVNM